jgi:hypothetical protein
MADGPIKFTGNISDNSMHIDSISQFGRHFSVVNVPYSLKLLMQELLSVNVSMRIITEDNIEQLENMSFSNNIDLLMQNKDTDLQTIVQNIKSTLRKTSTITTPQSISSPEYNPLSPYENNDKETVQNDDDESVGYVIGTPSFEPRTPDTPPPIEPRTPDTPPPIEPRTPDTPPPSSPSPIKQPTMGKLIGSPDSDDEMYVPLPPSSQSVGGSVIYNVGETVYYRGDSNPERLWQIIKIGPQFITIKTDDDSNIDRIDMIKVVLEKDIYKELDYSHYHTNDQNSLTNNIQELTKIPETTNPVINFQPVISINTDTNRVNDDSNNETANTQHGGEEKETTIMPGIKIKETPQTTNSSNTDNVNLFSGGIIVKKS